MNPGNEANLHWWNPWFFCDYWSCWYCTNYSIFIYSIMVFLVVASFSYMLSFLLCVLPKPSNMPGYCILNFTRGKLLHFGHFLSGNPIPHVFSNWWLDRLPTTIFQGFYVKLRGCMGNWFPPLFEAPNPSVVINNFAGFHCQGAARSPLSCPPAQDSSHKLKVWVGIPTKTGIIRVVTVTLRGDNPRFGRILPTSHNQQKPKRSFW